MSGEPEAAPGAEAPASPAPTGRGLPSVNALAAFPQRVSRALSLGLMVCLGAGLLAAYYHHALTHRAPVISAQERAAGGEVALPALPPHIATGAPDAPHYRIGSVLGENAPDLGRLGEEVEDPVDPPHPPASTPVDRRLTGAVFVAPGGPEAAPSPASTRPEATAATGLSAGFQTATTPAVLAHRLPTRRLWLPRGSQIDCTLQTAIDSSIPGLVTCLTATDTFGADGSVVLLERGTVLVGETRGEVRAGAARVGIIWTEARTPTGVIAALDSPATDALGRAGVDGAVDRHFWDRFGAALVLTLIDGALQAQASRGSGNTVIYGGSASIGVIEEVLKNTVNIPPTVRVAPATRVQALVARDVDFRGVYALRERP